MKKTNTYLILLLTLIWVSYIIWEIQVQKWADSQVGGGAIIRVDLIIFIPILVAASILIIYQIINNNKVK